jgi:hypothetical protein
MKTRTIHNVPYHVKQQLRESGDVFIYNNGRYLRHISKQNWYDVQCARIDILRRYTDPLRAYLTTYRLHHIIHTWDLNTSFRLFGVDLYGTMNPDQYKLFLIVQGIREGTPSGETWSGCLPFETYNDVCTRERLMSIDTLI